VRLGCRQPREHLGGGRLGTGAELGGQRRRGNEQRGDEHDGRGLGRRRSGYDDDGRVGGWVERVEHDDDHDDDDHDDDDHHHHHYDHVEHGERTVPRGPSVREHVLR
jgi:hypothetical protein